MAAKLVVIYWRDIPAQVNAQAGRDRHQVLLDHRFQKAIDRAAMFAGVTTAHDYVEQWRRETKACSNDLINEATSHAGLIDAEYTKDRLRDLAARGGIEGGDVLRGPGRDRVKEADAIDAAYAAEHGEEAPDPFTNVDDEDEE